LSGKNGGDDDFVIAKFDSNGNKTWIKNYGSPYGDRFSSIVRTADGGYAAAGYSKSSDGEDDDGDFVIAKFDVDGNTTRIKNYGGSSWDEFCSMVKTSDGGYAAAGSSRSSDGDLPGNKGGADFVIAKFDANGDLKAPKNIATATVTLTQTAYTYDGTAKTPAVTVTLNGATLTKDTDYTVAYSNNINVGTATVAVTGKGKYSGTVTAQFTITKPDVALTDIAGASLTLAKASYAYDGTAKTPAITVMLNGKTLAQGTGYTVAYSNNVNIGTATVTVTGKGDYKGSKTVSFKIIPKTVTVTKATVGKKLVKATWAKADAQQKITGYQIQYRIKGKSKWSKPTSVSAKKLTYTIKKLKKGKAYQIQVRAYKKVSGVSYSGAWSKTATSKKVK
jgi:hypothetical protein